MSSPSHEPAATALTIEMRAPYEFTVRVEGANAHAYTTGEGPPLGPAGNPAPDELLGAALATCLASSLLFCVQKAHVTVEALTGSVRVQKARNERGRLRIGSVEVAFDARVPDDQRERFKRCRTLFEEYCTVTESVRAGIPVEVALRVP